MFTCVTNSPEETAHLAELAGQKIREGTVLCLEGDLGAGKTLFVQSLARTLGVEGEVTSPTFNLMNIYEGICRIYHFDLYRLENETELEDIGFYEYTEEPEGIVVIEWPDKFPESLPDDYVEHGNVDVLRKEVGLDRESIVKKVIADDRRIEEEK